LYTIADDYIQNQYY